jgi:hypothetical protein
VLADRGHDLTKISTPGFAPQRQIAIGFNSIRASDSWRGRRKRNYAMSIKRLFEAVERRGDIGRRAAALVLPISNRPRVTSSCAGKIGLREPGEHTSGPNLASRDNVAHNQIYIRFWKRQHRSTRFVESRPGHTLSDGPRWLACLVAGGKMMEIARVKISEAGWQALAGDAINGRAKST